MRKRNNNTIQSIIIRRKNDPLVKLHTEFWYGSCFQERGSFFVSEEPYFRPWRDSIISRSGAWWFKGLDAKGQTIEFSLGDMGVPGYAYDDRPNLFCLTEEEGDIRAEEHRQWLDRVQEEDPNYGLYDDYW
uniref:Uncharacterized protein n=1 Tax=Pseudomonas phage RVTF4 TaxID=3236931 RepID=A0AB39CCY0_9VIRU